MDSELRKRFEEAAKKNWEQRHQLFKDAHIDIFREGADFGYYYGKEHGYKEAIKVVNEWLKERVKIPLFQCEENNIIYRYVVKQLIRYFEADMNKLWEGEK